MSQVLTEFIVKTKLMQNLSTRLSEAASLGNMELVLELLTQGNPDLHNPVTRAAENNHRDVVHLLIDRGAEIVDAVQVAAFFGHRYLVLDLLEWSKTVPGFWNPQRIRDQTFQHAVFRDHWEIVDDLIDQGISPEYLNKALHASGMLNRLDAIKKLLAYGGDINEAIRGASESKYPELVKVLRERQGRCNK